MWKDSEPDLWVGRVVVVWQLAALPIRRGSRAKGRTDHADNVRSRGERPWAAPEGLRHSPRVQGASKAGHSAAVDGSARDVKPRYEDGCCTDEMNRSTSHESSLSHQSELAPNVEGESKETESMISVETAEASVLFRAEPVSLRKPDEHQGQDSEVALELTLGMEPVSRAGHVVPVKKRRVEAYVGGGSAEFRGACKMELGL